MIESDLIVVEIQTKAEEATDHNRTRSRNASSPNFLALPIHIESKRLPTYAVVLLLCQTETFHRQIQTFRSQMKSVRDQT
jgi:hypothetical protein